MATKHTHDGAGFDEDALAKAYRQGLEAEKAGRFDVAESAYRQALAIDPADHAGVAVRLAGIGRGDTPMKAPDAYVMTLFDQHAEVFDTVLVDHLGYRVPHLMRQRIDALGLGPFDRMLDLGCGTGLSGEALRDIAGHITGVDLSENMIAMAAERDVFDELYVGEAARFLTEFTDDFWDLITATDVLPYLGAVDGLFAAAAARLGPGGLFALSTETADETVLAGRGFAVGPHQRFAHRPDYILDALAAAGFDGLALEDITVRMEEGAPIAGHLVIARRARSAPAQF